MNCELSFVLDTRRKLKNDQYPLKMRIYSERKYHLLHTGINLTAEQYSSMQLVLSNASLHDAFLKITSMQNRVSKLIESATEINIDTIKAIINNSDNVEGKLIVSDVEENVFEWFDTKVKALEENDQYGNAECYSSTKNVYKKILSSDYLPFSFFSTKRLKEIEQQLLERGVSISTIGKHARNLRTVFNMAIHSKVISNEIYPFGRNGYVIPATRKAKKSLTSDPLSALLKFEAKTKAQQEAILYFTFSYFANGMNLKDIATLKRADVRDGFITYYRKKTRHTSGQFNTIKVFITEEMHTILSVLQDTTNVYLFPILKPGYNEKEINRRVHAKNRSLNEALKQISNKLQLALTITLGMSRHTFANALKQQGVATDHISEMLGHSTVETTKHYLASLDQDLLSNYVDRLKIFSLSKK